MEVRRDISSTVWTYESGQFLIAERSEAIILPSDSLYIVD